jgi:flagellar biogenesis protein FliO
MAMRKALDAASVVMGLGVIILLVVVVIAWLVS